MGISRNVSLATALRYKGQGPMLTFILHRIGGAGMAIFISMHVLASALGGDIGNFINDIYMSWIFQIIIFFFVMFHAINGLRITILDLWPPLLEYQREAIWVEWAFFIPLYGFAVFSILSTAFGG
jgi:succinate dehydrogenase / fumarate reductase, cytochrome b subunit